MKISSKNVKEDILKAVDYYSKTLSKTYGPRAGKVIISSGYAVDAVDDGKIVAGELELEDETQNAVLMLIRNASSETDKKVKDGTTTSAIIFSEIVRSALDPSIFDSNHRIRVSRALDKALEEAVEQIKEASKECKTEKDLEKVALNSYNDPETARIIANLVHKVGEDGSIIVEESGTFETYSQIVSGMEIDGGNIGPHFDSTLKNPVIVTVDGPIEGAQMRKMLEKIVSAGETNIVIFSDEIDKSVIPLLILNKVNGTFKIAAIKTPGFGETKKDILQDIATSTGGIVFNEINKLGEATIDSFGRAEKVISEQSTTLIVGGKGKQKDIKARIEELKAQNPDAEFEKEKINKRIAKLKGGVAILYLGARTQKELEAKKNKVEDALGATTSALRGGIVGGAGKMFSKIKTSSNELNQALKIPRKVLEENGVEFLQENVFDPAEVQISALRSAISIAKLILETEEILADKREEEKENPSI